MIRSAYADAASVIPTRLSFRQLLVLISYISLECSLPATIGDTRQLEYLIQRDEKEWNPRWGLETLADMKQQSWQDLCVDAQRGWKKLHNYLAQQKAIYSTVSCEQLRDHLCHLLRGIEQISAQGLNALCDQRPASKLPNSLIGEKGSMILVCVSLSVITTATDHVPLRSLLMDPERQLIKEMCHQLRGSAVFQNPVTENQLWRIRANTANVQAATAAQGVVLGLMETIQTAEYTSEGLKHLYHQLSVTEKNFAKFASKK